MLNQNLLLTGDDGYNLTNSLRFRDSASAYLNRTPASASNRRTWTWSGWVKRGTLGAINDGIFSAGTSFGTNNNDLQTITFNNDAIVLVSEVGGSTQYNLVTSQVFRDPSAWYHFVIAFDTTQATSSNRVKLYVNGLQVTAFSTSTYPSQNYDGWINSANQHRIASRVSPDFDGYMAEVNFIDGQALTPSSFGSTNALTGVWQPAKYTGTYGTNGFYLPFTDNSALTTSSNVGLGRDYSGNGNYWTTNNISITAGSTYDSMTDVPTLTSATTANYAVMNPLNSASSMTPSGGNLNVVTSGVSVSSVSTIAVNSGKWYCEITIANVQDSTILGIAPSDRSYLSGAFYSVTGGVGYYQDGTKFISGSQSSYGASYTTNDVIGIALDMDAGTVAFYKNNTSQGTAASGLTGGYYFAVGDASSGSNTSYNVNFGQRPFTYTPPTGFVALNTFNLPEPSIKAGNKYMDALTWTGDGTSPKARTGYNFSPDFVWTKGRSGATDHALFDRVRGTGAKVLESNMTDAENNYGLTVDSFDANGFTTSTGSFNHSYANSNGATYVGWAWKANGTGVTNTAGSITSTVSANPTAGFSVVTYTGNGSSSATVGHGLGVAPSMIIVKSRSNTYSWFIRHSSLTAGYQLRFTADAQEQVSTATTAGGLGSGTSSVINFIAGSSNVDNVNANSATYVAYCFAEVAGYSKFGSYTGNGSTDGTFVHLGFRPKFVMMKSTSTAVPWVMYDSARDTYNVGASNLYPNLSNAEGVGASIDFLSNGFKLRTASGDANPSGNAIYMAFAENPFKNSLAR